MAGPYKEKSGAEIPGVPTQEGQQPVPQEDYSQVEGFDPSAGLPPIMPNDRVPSQASAPASPTATPAPAGQAAGGHPLDNVGFSETGNKGGGGYGLEVGDVGFGWHVGPGDFNPNGFRPNESRGTTVGKYGGRPLYAASLAFPSSVFASRIQAINNKEKQLEGALSKIAGDFEDVDNPKYHDGFQRWGNGQMRQYMADVQAMHGKRRGTELMMTPGTKEYEGFRNTVASINTVARGVNQSNKQALAVLEGMDKKVLQENPAVYKSALDLVDKQGSYAGVTAKELADSQTRLQANASLYDALTKQGIPEMLKQATSTEDLVSLVKRGGTGRDGEPLYSPGFVTYLNTAQTVTPEGLVNALTDDWAQRYKGDLSRDQVKAVIEGMVPQDFKEKISTRQIRSADGGSGGNAANSAANYRVEQTAMPEGTVNAFGVPAGSSDRGAGGNTGFTGSYPTITLFGSSNKQAKLTNPLSFRYGDKDVFMYPERVMQVGTMPMILGKEVGMPRTRAQQEAAADGMGWTMEHYNKVIASPQYPEAQAVIERFGVLRPMTIPLLGNEAQIEGMGYDPERIKAELRSMQPEKAQAQQPQPATASMPDFVKEGGYAQSDWDALTDQQRAAILKAGKL